MQNGSPAQPDVSLAPRETRYNLRGETDVAIQRRHDRQPRVATGKLLDLTVSGAKLSTVTPLPIDETVTLFFRFGEPGLNFMVEAQVRWTRPAKELRWWLGCAFSPKMDEEHLASLADDGFLDRRQEPRRKVSLAAKARWELADARELAVQIEDVSSGGVRISAPQGAEPGQRLLIEAAGRGGRSLLIPTRCQWQVAGQDRVHVGCSFVEATGFAQLSEALEADQPSASVPRRGRRRNWLWPWA